MNEGGFMHKKGLLAGLSVVVCGVVLYGIFAFSSIPFVVKWRTIYIETAMSTMTHQWLATAFLPPSVVNEAMLGVEAQFEENLIASSEIAENAPQELPEELSVLSDGPSEIPEEPSETPEEQALREFTALFPEIDMDTLPDHISWQDLPALQVERLEGVRTTAGDKVWAIDVPNKLIICTVTGDGYQGKLAIVKDSSQVMLARSTLSSRGQTVTELCQANGAVLGVNASGFQDPEGRGNGKTPVGFVLSDGNYSGTAMKGRYQIAGFDLEDNFRTGYGLLYHCHSRSGRR